MSVLVWSGFGPQPGRRSDIAATPSAIGNSSLQIQKCVLFTPTKIEKPYTFFLGDESRTSNISCARPQKSKTVSSAISPKTVNVVDQRFCVIFDLGYLWHQRGWSPPVKEGLFSFRDVSETYISRSFKPTADISWREIKHLVWAVPWHRDWAFKGIISHYQPSSRAAPCFKRSWVLWGPIFCTRIEMGELISKTFYFCCVAGGGHSVL